MVRGEKKVSFAACPSGKLYLTSTSTKVIFTNTKKFFRKQKKKRAVLLSAPPHCRIFFQIHHNTWMINMHFRHLEFRNTYFWEKKNGVETVKPKFSMDTLSDNIDNAKSCQRKRFILQFAAGVFLSNWQEERIFGVWVVNQSAPSAFPTILVYDD